MSSSDLRLEAAESQTERSEPGHGHQSDRGWRRHLLRVFGVRSAPGGCCPCAVQHHLRFAWWALVLLFLAIVLALAIAKLARGDVTVDGVRQHKHWVAVVVGGAFVICGSVITALQIHGHAAHYTVPEVQGKIVRIALIVPVFAWTAWLSLVFMELAPYFDFVHECYEAYTIYNFVLLLIRYMGGPEGAERLMARKDPASAPWPACCGLCCSAAYSIRLLDRLRKATLQFVFIAPAVALVAAIGGLNGRYQEGEATAGNLYPWCTLVLGASKLVALYALIWFYKATKAELAPFQPLTKFLVVKSVVFLTFFQGVLIAILGARGALHASDEFTSEELEATLQNFIVCVEMFFVAAAHRVYFGHEPFADGTFDRQTQEMAALHRPAPGTAAAQEEEAVLARDRELIAKLAKDDPDTLA